MKKQDAVKISDTMIGAGTTSACSTIADEMLRKSGQTIQLNNEAHKRLDRSANKAADRKPFSNCTGLV